MSSESTKVLALSSYPVEAAATRFRIGQFVSPLSEAGIEVDVRPFLDHEGFKSFYRDGDGFERSLKGIAGTLNRLEDVFNAGRYEVVFVQREAMFFGPEIFEWVLAKIRGLPLVLDLDDATYVPYRSPRFGRFGSALKFFGKTDRLIDLSEVVVCGNRFIAEYAESRGSKTVVIPTIVDHKIFRPTERSNSIPVLGWIGTHSTFPSLESIFPILQRLAKKHEFILRIVGSGREAVSIEGVNVENVQWSLQREVKDFQNIDIGLYPIAVSSSADEEWLKGKSGFKAIQYMAVGVPFVMSPVGVCAEMGVSGKTHFNAVSEDDWYTFLDKLLTDTELRLEMGTAARAHSLKHYLLADQADKLEAVLMEVASRSPNS